MVQRVETTRANGSAAGEVESVLIRVPAHKDYLVVVRSALAQLGARLGYTVAEIIDLRLAVDETCCLLIGENPPDGPPRGDLECRVRVGPGTLRIMVCASAADVRPPDRDGFGWKVLTALVDSLTWVRDGSIARVEMEKRHSPLLR
ncbi:ATP-binding protein [Catenulispora subtropica]|uniref:Histidine kinase/HSP90-like ATPase domain-containing protein n=1 Tax=Catenulispora subtropica TaxID=450798 RepID=A0ABN2T984_9ACTN